MTQPPPEPQPQPPGYGQPAYPQPQPGYPEPGLPGYPGMPPQPYPAPGQYGSPYQPYPGGGYPQYRFGKDPVLAEWWQRLLARFIDGLVIFVLTSWVTIPLYISYLHRVTTEVANGGTPPSTIGVSFLVGLVVGVVGFFYDWLQHGLWGQTLGKRALGTIVVTADTRSKISGGAAAGRAAVYALPQAIPYVGTLFSLLNELWLLFDNQRQCLHDKAARTVVVKKNLLAALRAQAPAGYPGGGAAYPGYPGGPTV